MTHPAGAQLDELGDALSAARRPLALLGGSRWSAGAVADFTTFAEAHALPVLCSFRRQMLFSADHPCYAGDLGLGANPRLVQRVKDADLWLLLGGRLSEVPSQGYSVLDIPSPSQRLVHVHPDPEELARVYRPWLAINASPGAFAAALRGRRPSGGIPWQVWNEEARADYVRWSDAAAIRIPGSLQMGEVMLHLRRKLPRDAVMCNGAGNFATWVHRFWRFNAFGTQLAPTSGSMGYGPPAGIAAQRLWPDRTVVVFTGDGDFLMHGQEFATAVQYDLPVLVILLDNGMYGTIRMHQERHYPGRVSGTDLRNPDFTAYARAFGGHGERVETTADFGPALARAIASRRPALLHCRLDPQAITPTATLDEIAAAARGGAG